MNAFLTFTLETSNLVSRARARFSSDLRPVFNLLSNHLSSAMLHIMTPVGIFLLLAPIRDETNVLNGDAHTVGLATIGGGTCDCSEECG